MGLTAPANTAALNEVGGERPELLWEEKRQVSDAQCTRPLQSTPIHYHNQE